MPYWDRLLIPKKENNLAVAEKISDHCQHTRFFLLRRTIGRAEAGIRIKLNAACSRAALHIRSSFRNRRNVTGSDEPRAASESFPRAEVA